MKHFFTFLLLVFSTVLFSKETISISGKITNLEGNELIIVGLNFNLIIPVNPDGSYPNSIAALNLTLTRNQNSAKAILKQPLQK